MSTATLLMRLEIKLSPMVLDMCSVLLGIHLLHIWYHCSLRTNCIDTMFTTGANSTPSKRAQFQHPCQSTHTSSSDNLLLDFEGVSLCFCSCHLQANVLQVGKTSCTSWFGPGWIHAQIMSHMHQHHAMQNVFNKRGDT